MPFIGIVEYRFVKPRIGSDGKPYYVHPRGWKFQYVKGNRADLIAEMLDEHVARYAELSQTCPDDGHVKCGAQREGEWMCHRWIRLSKEAQRTNERTLCIRVEIPI